MNPDDTGLSRLLEEADAASARDLAEAADRQMRRALAIRSTRLGEVTAVSAGHLDVLAYNRVIGLGMEHPAEDTLLDQIVTWFRAGGIPRFFVQVSPFAQPEDLAARLASRGLAHYNNWVKLWRSTSKTPAVRPGFEVVEARQEHAHAFAALVVRGFNVPGAAAGWIARLIGRAGWHHYVALDQGHVVATGSLFVVDRTGWLGFAATEAAWRGRGAQSALIARRIADARALGLDLLAVETAEDTPEHRAPSFHNLRRFGFQPAYVRPNFLWNAPPSDRPAA